MDRLKIKMNARAMIKDNLWIILKPLLIISLIMGLAGGIIGIIFGTESDITELLLDLINLATMPLSFGYTVYILKFIRKESLDSNEIFKYYSQFIPIVLLNLLTGLFTTLGLIIFIIPGIIISLMCQQAQYIMIDDNLEPMDCIKKSKEMMLGYKTDYFLFMLSFTGWILFSILTLGIGLIYVIPYITVCQALYYEELKKITKNV